MHQCQIMHANTCTLIQKKKNLDLCTCSYTSFWSEISVNEHVAGDSLSNSKTCWEKLLVHEKLSKEQLMREDTKLIRYTFIYLNPQKCPYFLKFTLFFKGRSDFGTYFLKSRINTGHTDGVWLMTLWPKVGASLDPLGFSWECPWATYFRTIV